MTDLEKILERVSKYFPDKSAHVDGSPPQKGFYFVAGSEFESVLQTLCEVIKVQREAITKHHKVWSDNSLCLSECSQLCKALAETDAKLKELADE